MSELRFTENLNPGDGNYRIMNYFKKERLDWAYQNKIKDELKAGVYPLTISRTPLGCGYCHPELATRIYEDQPRDIIQKQIKELENFDLSRQPPLRSHARGLMTVFEMDKLDGINVRKILERNPTFYSDRYKTEVGNGVKICETVPNTTDDCGLDLQENMTGACHGGDTMTAYYVTENKKPGLRKRFLSLIRRIGCMAVRAE